MEGATLDGSESNDNTVSGPSQFQLVACNMGKPSDLTPFSIVEKRLPAMPTIPVLAQPILCAPTTSSIFSVTTIVSEQHRKATLDRFDPSLLRTRVENLMTHISKYQELLKNFSGKLTETALSTCLAAIKGMSRRPL
ncbi:hypothetical protein ACH5RR_021696 [Cinchona calisaya]|uniref:Uncharacterized protein n=1 Tax=Cinchona calisaya TaxID=153742 RepID=A0ABD2ZLV6_9GENT